MSHNSSTKKKLSLKKTLGYGLLTLLLLAIVAELGLRMVGAILRPSIDKSARDVDDCKSLVFLAMGDSMTFGLGAKRNEAYPMQMIEFLERAYPGTNVKVYNIAIPGANTSEGLHHLEDFFAKNPGAVVDFALLLYGMNNRWNLHDATFWQWDKSAKRDHLAAYVASNFQLNKAVSVATQSGRAALDSVSEKQRRAAKEKELKDYRDILDEHNWDVFFPDFKDDLLVRWIKHDYREFNKEVTRREIQPIWLNYFSPVFDNLNPLIAKAVSEDSAPIIDVEKPSQYYSMRGFFAHDGLHMKAEGYGDVAKRFSEEFVRIYPHETIKEITEKKRLQPLCRLRSRN